MKLAVYILTLLSIIIVSCKKQTFLKDDYKVYDFFKANTTEEQVFTIDAAQGGTITTANGTQLIFQPNGFKNSSNQIIAGEVEVRVREIYSKSEMIKNNITSVSDGRLLVSGGEFQISAYSLNGKLSPAVSYTVAIPSQDSIPMQLFYGNIVNTAQNQNNQINNFAPLVNWEADTTLFTYNDGYYVVNASRFDWINADYFYEGNTPDSIGLYDTLAIAMPENYNTGNTVIFISFDGLNACVPYNSNISGYIYWDYALPSGLPIHIITISNINDEYYFSNTATVVNNLPNNIVPTKKTETEILSEINALP